MLPDVSTKSATVGTISTVWTLSVAHAPASIGASLPASTGGGSVLIARLPAAAPVAPVLSMAPLAPPVELPALAVAPPDDTLLPLPTVLVLPALHATPMHATPKLMPKPSVRRIGVMIRRISPFGDKIR
jgi:hypothetical protein